MPHKALDNESCYRLLKLLEQNPDLSQRDIAEALGISLGKANNCVRALIDRGWVKMINFRQNGHKAAYLYKLTPQGITEKAHAARRFLRRKLEEYDQIAVEIETLRGELRPSHEK